MTSPGLSGLGVTKDQDGNMTKTATKMADAIEFPTFDASKATDQLRAFAEKGVEQSKEAYSKFKTGAEEAQKVIEATYETAKAASSELSKKSIAALRTTSEAGFNHLEALSGVKSLSELVELQTSFLRQSYEMMVEQAKDFQSVSSKAMQDVTQPAKAAFEKATKELKIA
jgi:phasin